MVVFEGVAYVLWLAPINIGLNKQQAKRRDFIQPAREARGPEGPAR